MSSVDERLAVQAKMQVEELTTENLEEHGRIERLMTAGFKSTDRRIDKLAARLGIGAIAVTVATIFAPAWTAVATSSSKSEIRTQAAESARQATLLVLESYRSEFRAECRSRDADLAYIADLAAQKAAKTVTFQTEKVPR